MSNAFDNILPVFNTILNYQQSLRLEEVAALNKSILKQNFLQNKKLEELNKQMASANAVQKQILENQINEIKEREKQQLYKSEVFKATNMIEAIASADDILLQKYLLNNYYELIKYKLTDAISSLVEISDKEYSKNSIKNLENLKNTTDSKTEEYSKSYLSRVDELVKDYNIQKAEIDNYKREAPNKINFKIKSRSNVLRVFVLVIIGMMLSLLFLSLLVSAFENFNNFTSELLIPFVILISGLALPFYFILRAEIKWRKNYIYYKENIEAKYKAEVEKNNELKKKQNDEYNNKLNLLNLHLAITAMKEINLKHPAFINKTQELLQLSKS